MIRIGGVDLAPERARISAFITLERFTKSAAATERFAAELARRLRAPRVILLDGALGAGKTTFARGFVRALPGGERVVVQSPTFALARTYATAPRVHHLDLYRMLDAGEGALEELGLMDMLRAPDAFSLVEWPGSLRVEGAAIVTFTEQRGGRIVRVDVDDRALLSP